MRLLCPMEDHDNETIVSYGGFVNLDPIFLDFDIIAFSFVFDSYCPTMD